MTKRPSDCSDDAVTAQPKRSSSSRHAFIMPELLQLNADTELFFCALYRDLLTHLTRFVMHGVPYIEDPEALRCTSVVEMSRERMGTHWPDAVWLAALSHTGLPAQLYMREPDTRCVRLFQNEECTTYADYDVGPWRHAVNEHSGEARRIFFAESKLGLSLYIISTSLRVGNRLTVTMEHLDVYKGRLVDTADTAIEGPEHMFSLSADGQKLFAVERGLSSLGALLVYDALNLGKQPLRAGFDQLAPPGKWDFECYTTCPYGLVQLRAMNRERRHEVRLVRSYCEPDCDYAVTNLREDEMRRGTFGAGFCLKDQRRLLYMPRITTPQGAYVCVYARDRIVCRVEIPRCMVFLDMKMAAPNTVSLLCLDSVHIESIAVVRFIRCTVP